MMPDDQVLEMAESVADLRSLAEEMGQERWVRPRPKDGASATPFSLSTEAHLP